MEKTLESNYSLSRVETKTNKEEVEPRQIHQVLKSFIEALELGPVSLAPPFTSRLEELVSLELVRLDISIPSAIRWVLFVCQVVEIFYPNHPTDLKVIIALCNIVILHIEDTLTLNTDILNNYQLAIHRGDRHEDPLLQCMMHTLLPQMWDYYSPLAASGITIVFSDFVIGTSMETMTKNMVLHESAVQFPEYLRLKSGMSEAYGHWIFYPSATHNPLSYIQAMPDLVSFINRLNDTFSFYKEDLDGEVDNYVHMQAKLVGCTPLESLERVSHEGTRLYKQIVRILTETSSLKELASFKRFSRGYIRFHLSTPRYRLEDVFPEA